MLPVSHLFGFLLLWLVMAVRASVPCPTGCSCVGQTISCRKTGLTKVPSLPQIVQGPNGGALQFLMIIQNPMIRLERGSFENQLDLVQIELAFNQLVWISKEAFIGIPSLRRLSLRGNRIAYLPHELFAPIFMLTELDLSKNQLRSLPFSLEGLVYLKRLSLFANPLHCPCDLVDFAMNLGHLEPPRFRVTCHGPSEVAHTQLSTLAKRTIAVVSNTRLLGYQALNDSDRDEFIRTQPYIPRPNDLQGHWPWSHCPVQDFGGHEPRLVGDSSEDTETDISGDDGLLYPDRPYEFARWRDVPKSAEVVAGEVTRFICGADGHRALQVSWILPPNATSHIRLYRRRQILEIHETHDYHEGTYTCVISSKNGQHMTADATLRLISAVKPKIFDSPPAEDNQVQDGSDVQLRCSSEGRPRPRIFWLWQEETLPLQLVTGGRYIVRSTAGGTLSLPSETLSVYGSSKHIVDNVESSITNSVLLIRNVTRQDTHGRYICLATNRVGSARVSTSIQLTANRDEPLELSLREPHKPQVSDNNDVNELHTLTGDELVKRVIDKARVRIEAAIKKTADRLRDTSRRRSSTDVAFLFRQPNQAALELSKVAEVYETVIDEVTTILRQRSQQKLELNRTDEISELVHLEESDPHSREVSSVQLSADQLAIISQLSGCQETSNLDSCSRQMCFHLRYRSIDGACNNFNHPRWGAALSPLRRLLPPQYENGINTPIGWSPARLYFGYPKPSARLVSRELLGNATILGRHTIKLRELEEWNKRRQATEEHPDILSGTEYDTNDHTMTRKLQVEQTLESLAQFREKHGNIFDEDEKFSGMLMQWGQFLDHDLDFTPVDASISRFSDGLNCNETCVNDPPCFPILVPPGDPRIKHRCIGFSRSTATCGSGSTSILLGKPHHREQLNQITSFIDASSVYGSDEFESGQLRDTLHDEGRMRTGMPTPSGKRLLPFNIRGQVDCQADPQQDFVPCFKAGDHRSNENLGLLSMHTLWVREHNRLADGLRSLNPDWTGDRVYQEARKIVGACMQAITYQVWLPIILGPEGMKLLGTYVGYDDRANPTISNEFATAAMRFGHTLISPVLFRLDENWEPIPEGHLHLHQAFFAPDRMLKDGGMDPIIRGLLFYGVRDRSRNPPLNSELTERLFSMAHELALDLAALNIQRGRDHGLPSYTEYAYKFCGLGSGPHPNSFDELAPRISNTGTLERLRKVYGHPGNVDLFTGAILEDLLPEARVGPTFACIIADQFKRLRDGDRFWYEANGVFTSAQLAEIKRSGAALSRVICEASDNITEVPRNSFLRPIKAEDIISCSKIPKINLASWIDCSPNPTESHRSDGVLTRRRRSITEDPQNSCPAYESKRMHDETIEKLKRSIVELQMQLNTLNSKMNRLTQQKTEDINVT